MQGKSSLSVRYSTNHMDGWNELTLAKQYYKSTIDRTVMTTHHQISSKVAFLLITSKCLYKNIWRDGGQNRISSQLWSMYYIDQKWSSMRYQTGTNRELAFESTYIKIHTNSIIDSIMLTLQIVFYAVLPQMASQMIPIPKLMTECVVYKCINIASRY